MIRLLPHKFDVTPIHEELKTCSGWNLCRLRTQGKSPHRECDDIWLRWQTSPTRDDKSFDCGWYDVADELPEAVKLCEEVFRLYGGVEMGGVLITRIPAGKQVYPHSDHGWHARRYEKFAVQIQGHKDQSFCFEGESLSPVSGELFWFDNSQGHWVKNPTDQDRITMIICIRRTQ